MRRNFLAALVLSGAFVVPASLASTALADDMVQGGYESLSACQSAIPQVRQQHAYVPLTCKSYMESNIKKWGIYRTTSNNEEETLPEE
jgi:hypothetical protein